MFLFQRGSSESKDPDKKEEVDENADSKAEKGSEAPLPVKKGGLILMLYNHSLSLAFMVLFIVSFVGHAVCGAKAHNEEALEHGRNVLSIRQYLGSSQFWFESFQNWQSDCHFHHRRAVDLAPEKGSPESKPVSAAHSQTAGG